MPPQISRFSAGLILVGVVIASGCAKPVLTRRYATLAAAGTLPSVGSGSGLELTASAFPIDPASQRTVFDLGSEGQSAYVAAIATRIDKSMSLQHELAVPISRRNGGVVDRTAVSRRVVLSISADHMGLGDRFDAGRIDMVLTSGVGAKFKSWNQLATKFEVVDLGKLTFSQKDAASYGLEGVVPGISEITKATTGGSRERTMGEEVQLRQRYVATTGALTPTTATIVQQGAVGIDLVGNAVFDISLAAAAPQEARVFSVDGLFVAGQAAPQENVKLTRSVLKYAEKAVDWEASLTASFRRRKVAAGTETITESDDTVAYEVVPAKAALVLVAADELRVSKWRLVDANCRVVHVLEAGRAIPLEFDSFDGADQTLDWLLATDQTSIATRPLGFEIPPFTTPSAPKRWAGLRVEMAGLNWVVPKMCGAP